MLEDGCKLEGYGGGQFFSIGSFFSTKRMGKKV